MVDLWAYFRSNIDSPAYNHFVVTPNNTIDFAISTRAIYVGRGGDMEIVTHDNVAVVYANTIAGSTLPVRAKRINSSNTTAGQIVGLY
jgi:hypothetical protein